MQIVLNVLVLQNDPDRPRRHLGIVILIVKKYKSRLVIRFAGRKNAAPVTRVRRFYEAGDKLLPSGLLGPVVLKGYE